VRNGGETFAANVDNPSAPAAARFGSKMSTGAVAVVHTMASAARARRRWIETGYPHDLPSHMNNTRRS
jgi:hypothetical protein